MSSSSGSTYDQPENRSSGHCCGGWGGTGNWSGMNIAAMVLGFVVFWPLGLFMLYWILKGRKVQELPQGFRRQWSKVSRNWHGTGGISQHDHGDNVVFNEFQQTQYDRIREIKDEIKERSRRFTDFRANARRRADEEEFNRFMSDTPVRNDG